MGRKEAGMFVDIPHEVKAKLDAIAALSHPKMTRKELVAKIISDFCNEVLRDVKLDETISSIKANLEKAFAE